jgi:hypothetical protein
MAGKWSYASVEWVWAGSQIRMNFPGQPEQFRQGTYQDVVELLTQLGGQGWEVVACVGVADWLYWTLKFHHVSRPSYSSVAPS